MSIRAAQPQPFINIHYITTCWIIRLIRTLLVTVCALLVLGCQSMYYYGQAIDGQLLKLPNQHCRDIVDSHQTFIQAVKE